MAKKKRSISHLRVQNKSNNLEAYFKEFESSRNPITNLFYNENHFSSWMIRRFGLYLYRKIYAWFAGIMSVGAMAYMLFDSSNESDFVGYKIIESVILVLFVIVIFAWAYRKRILKAYVWKFFILIIIVDDLYSAINLTTTEIHDIEFWLALIIACILNIVNIIIVYQYAFKFFPEDKKGIKQLKARKTIRP